MNENKDTSDYAITKNYSITKLTSLLKTDEFLNNGGSSQDHTIRYVFNLSTNPQRLKDQAVVFALNFKTHGQYNFEKLFGCNDYTSTQILEHMYVYSYLKSLYSIYFDRALTYEDDGGWCFIGHSKMYYLAQQKSYTFSHQNVSTSAYIDLGDEKSRIIEFALLLNQFPFFDKYMKNLAPIGKGGFYISFFEQKFSKIMEDYYAKAVVGEPEFVSKYKDFNEGENLKLIPMADNENGKIKIVKLKSEACISIMNRDQNPLTNTFYGENCENLYHLEVNGNFVTKFNESFFFTLANFFLINIPKSDSNLILRYYKMTKINRDQNFLLNSEVYVNTGIKPKISLNRSK
jgi:hypothetical protein